MTGTVLALGLGLLSVFYAAGRASAANDEPDLVPFWGTYPVGCTWDNGCGGGHHGTATPAIDFPMPEGTGVLAAGAGTARLYEDECAGKYIEVWHSGVQKYSRYLHLSAYAVRDGDAVQRGQIIARSGNTGAAGGCSTGPHLHYDELNAARRRVDPGIMVGWSGGVWSTYPAAAGAAGWSQISSFSGPALRNDFTITAATPTTLLSTTPVTTTPPASPPAGTTPTATPAPPSPPTATTRPPGATLAEGALFRAGDAPNIFLYAAGSPWWVPDPTQLELLGGWGRVQEAGPRLDSLLSAMPWRPLQAQAFVEADSAQMYWCAGGSPWPVPSMAELDALHAPFRTSGWYRLPGGARLSQWACGGTLPDTVFQQRGATGYWAWTASGWTSHPDAAALAAAGLAGRPVHVVPASG